MTYDIVTTLVGEELTRVDVTVLDAIGNVVTTGETVVCTADQALARQYAEDVFLADLRHNDKHLAGLTLPIDSIQVDPPAGA